MSRRPRILLLSDRPPASDRLAAKLQEASFEVALVGLVGQAVDAIAQGDTFDLLLIDATERPDVVEAVYALRERWPELSTPLLVLGAGDTATAAAAIDAGATDSVLDAVGGPLMDAHIRRLLRIADVMRVRFDEECQRARRETMAKAAADVAVPLGALLDTLEVAMTDSPVSERLDELLELTSDAVDAVDRLRQLSDASDH